MHIVTLYFVSVGYFAEMCHNVGPYAVLNPIRFSDFSPLYLYLERKLHLLFKDRSMRLAFNDSSWERILIYISCTARFISDS